MTYHIMCFSHSFRERFIGTNVQTLDNIFEYVEQFFGTKIHKIEVVETGATLEKIVPGMQLSLF
ncbi:MAG: hypothetical protein EOM15_11965 [Spirochaetia bacterium]|nr:hypothetical protein [Spirochaetia bacterium]